MEGLKLMRKYNIAIESYKRAEVYFAREDITPEEKVKRVNDCKGLVNHINDLLNKIREVGYNPSDDEVINGFRQLKYLEEGGVVNAHQS